MKNNLWNILKKELREMFRDKKSLSMMLVIPIFVPLIVLGMSALFDVQANKDIDEYNQIGFAYKLSEEEKSIAEELNIKVTEGTEEELKNKNENNEIDLYITKENNKYIINGNDSEEATYAKSLMESYFNVYKEYLQGQYLQKNDIKNTPKEEVTPQYVFDITYKDTNFTNINLIDTIKSKTLVDEKIAPGIKGEFDIIIKTNKDTKYQIYFISQNEKPKNLEFKIDKTEISTNRLEDLKEYLHGNLKKGETKTITIKWNWNYENELEGNIQDTKDAKNIDKYVFDIYTYGEQEI